MPVRNYSFSANETKSFGPGNALRILESTAEVTVRYFREGTEIFSEAAEGVQAGYAGIPPRPADRGFAFDDAQVTSATAQTVKILTTRGHSRYDRSVGDVVSTPKLTQLSAEPVGHDALTDNNYSFVGFSAAGAAAANYAHSQLLNPSGSGKVVYLDKLILSPQAVTVCLVGVYNPSLSSFRMNGSPKKLGGSDATAELREELNVNNLVTGTDVHFAINFSAGTSFEMIFEDPYELVPGTGICALNQNVNEYLYAVFQFREYS